MNEFNVTRDFDITGTGDVWYARPQLFFKCTLCPTGETDDPRKYKEYSLVFFSTFKPISLTPDNCMQQKGVPMLYRDVRSATVLPSLYVCPVENVLGRVPLIPCYLNGNSSNTIMIQYRYRDRGAIPAEAAADSRPDSGTGSRLFKIRTFGCGATAERFHSRSQWPTLSRWQCGRSEFRNPGNGRLQPLRVGERRLLPGPRAVTNCALVQTRYRVRY